VRVHKVIPGEKKVTQRQIGRLGTANAAHVALNKGIDTYKYPSSRHRAPTSGINQVGSSHDERR
jgi:hypothetical protein